MTHYICVTCGTQFADSQLPPAHCPICEDERQYIGWNGQQWTTLADLRQSRHNLVKAQEPGLTGIGSDPRFAIGQRAILVQTKQGKVPKCCCHDYRTPTLTGQTRQHCQFGHRSLAYSPLRYRCETDDGD